MFTVKSGPDAANYMTDDKGLKKKAEGEAREDYGKMTGDKSEEAHGAAQKVEGDIREGADKIKNKVHR